MLRLVGAKSGLGRVSQEAPKSPRLSRSTSPEIALNEEREDWSCPRRAVASVVEHKYFEMGIGAVIGLNVVVMVLDTNANVNCGSLDCGGLLLQTLSYIMLAVYTLEVALRSFAYRSEVLRSSWDLLDIFIVVTGALDAVLQGFVDSDLLPDTNMLKMFRILRVVRAARLVGLFPALQSILRGFASAIQAMFWGGVTIMALLLMFGIFAVEVVHPKSKEVDYGSNWWCEEAFTSVQSAILFFFQSSLAGDSWGLCVIPLILKHWHFFFFFAAVLFLIQLGVMNLILTAIVDEANLAHEQDIEARFRAAMAEESQQVQQLGPVFKEIDVDKSGALSVNEIMAAYDRDPRLQHIFKLLSIDRLGLYELFNLMDADGDGSIEQEEFIKAMYDTHKQDMRTQVMTVKLQLSHVSRALSQKVDLLAGDLHSMADRLSGIGPVTELDSFDLKIGQASYGNLIRGACGNSGEASAPACIFPTSAETILAIFEEELEAFRQGLRSQVASLAGGLGGTCDAAVAVAAAAAAATAGKCKDGPGAPDCSSPDSSGLGRHQPGACQRDPSKAPSVSAPRPAAEFFLPGLFCSCHEANHSDSEELLL